MNTVKFGDIFEFNKKSNIKAGDGIAEGCYPFYTSSPVISKYLNTFQFTQPSLIFGTGGNASVHVTNNPFSTSTDCLVSNLTDKAKPYFEIKYVYYYLYGNIHLLDKGFRGAGLKHISKDYISKIEIPIQPYDFQKDIIKTLDLVNTLEQKRKLTIVRLDEYLKSTFLDFFGDPVINSKNWKLSEIGHISNSRLGKMRDKKQISGNYLKKYLGNSNIKWFQFDLSNLLEMDFNEQEQIKYQLRQGDLLVCEGGEIGRCAIWNEQLTDCYFQKAIHRIRTNNKIVLPEYLQWILWFYSKGNAFRESRTQATIAHLTGEKLKRLKVPIADIEKQKIFAAILEQTNDLKQMMLKQLEELNNQFQSYIQKYFNLPSY